MESNQKFGLFDAASGWECAISILLFVTNTLMTKQVRIGHVRNFIMYCIVVANVDKSPNADAFRALLAIITTIGSFRELCYEILVFLAYYSFEEEQIEVLADALETCLSRIQYNVRQAEKKRLLALDAEKVYESSTKKARVDDKMVAEMKAKALDLAKLFMSEEDLKKLNAAVQEASEPFSVIDRQDCLELLAKNDGVIGNVMKRKRADNETNQALELSSREEEAREAQVSPEDEDDPEIQMVLELSRREAEARAAQEEQDPDVLLAMALSLL